MSGLGELPQSVGRWLLSWKASPPDEEPKPLTKGPKETLSPWAGWVAWYSSHWPASLQFTLALLPLAFGNPSSTPTAIGVAHGNRHIRRPSRPARRPPQPQPRPPPPPPSSTPTAIATALPTATIRPFAVQVNRPRLGLRGTRSGFGTNNRSGGWLAGYHHNLCRSVAFGRMAN